jgi:hypothetical protein
MLTIMNRLTEAHWFSSLFLPGGFLDRVSLAAFGFPLRAFGIGASPIFVRHYMSELLGKTRQLVERVEL